MKVISNICWKHILTNNFSIALYTHFQYMFLNYEKDYMMFNNHFPHHSLISKADIKILKACIKISVMAHDRTY